MCRLLGVIANKPVDLEFSLERFKEFAKWNPDGWGIGWFEGRRPKIFKQGISAIADESKFPILSKEVRSKIIIVHVRKGTGAEPAERNSHPFKYENWIFAHNGYIDRDYLLSLLNAKYKSEINGETDSEVYFHWIIQCIDEEGDVVRGIKRAIEYVVKREHSGLNFLLSDGYNLYAFRYSSHSRNYYTLYMLRRSPSNQGLVELSKETGALLQSKTLKGEKAVLVCSEKLTNEKWKEIEFGKLLIINSNLEIKEAKIL